MGTTLEFDRGAFKQPWPRLLPHATLLLILILYGVRAYERNFDWRSDVTLAQATIKAAPQGFRSYDKLAEAYHETDPILKVDQSIELTERAIAILDPLPDNENSSRSYLSLGIYYALKGDTAATRNADGSMTVNEIARGWYQKSAQVLERGSEIDRAANDAYRVRELKHGKSDVADAGLSDLYLYLGMVYSRLGLNEKAIEAFKYMRQLDPNNPAAYAQMAAAQRALGQVEDAVISLTQCVIVDPQRGDAWQSLAEIYSQINRDGVPAVQVSDGRPYMLEENKLVRQYLLYAYQGFMRIARASTRSEMFREAHDTAVNRYHFDPKALDEAANEEVPRPMPPGPVFHIYGRKLSLGK
jgi:tetratricopeptide (TPR) repeat protein